MSFKSWKLLFLLAGALTVLLGVAFLWWIPDNQTNARWLNAQDRLLAIERVRTNQQGIGNKKFKWYQFKGAFSDPLTWAFVFYGLVGDIPSGGLVNFFNQLVPSSSPRPYTLHSNHSLTISRS
jgi:ACS family allantoate permease-like MFS transporter